MDEPVYTLTPQQLIEVLEDAIHRYHRFHQVYGRSTKSAAQSAINQALENLKPDRQLQAEVHP